MMKIFSRLITGSFLAISGLLLASCAHQVQAQGEVQQRPNIIFILIDDQRYDELGFLNPLLDTPNMDRMAAGGVFFKNAFVTTSLCSPSRATILTGQYMHEHGVVDNNIAVKPDAVFFPEYLQQAGYQTALVGKWHMGGHSDMPRPGFDHWVSFAGQGSYLPTTRSGKVSMLNINGEQVKQKGYITDELTDYAVDWLDTRDPDKPFFLYLSHKAVHSDFVPAERHRAQYAGEPIIMPESMADTPDNYDGKPLWVKNQRNSWHGVDFPYHSELDIKEYKRRYHQTLSAVDDSLGRVMSYLEQNGLEDNTVIIFMGDNGFLFGEHGLIDKRNAYEESMRVPMLAYGPAYFEAGQVRTENVANLDIAPTILDLAGVEKPDAFVGRSFVPLAMGQSPEDAWREDILYEYYWEYNYPHTPTTFAVRTDRYKLIQYHGVWDREELYDLQTDPKEMTNLIQDPNYLAVKIDLRKRLFALLENDQGEHVVGYSERKNTGAVYRAADGGETADFPQNWLKHEGDAGLRKHHTPDRAPVGQDQTTE